ncbi:hypothetical protein LguiA_022606 [Lonicera macranthoides]
MWYLVNFDQLHLPLISSRRYVLTFDADYHIFTHPIKIQPVSPLGRQRFDTSRLNTSNNPRFRILTK